jgi:hypothetical protein
MTHYTIALRLWYNSLYILLQGERGRLNTLFDGRYRIVDTLGRGGMGTVYLAESVSLGTKWAVKAVSKKQSLNFDLLAAPTIL